MDYEGTACTTYIYEQEGMLKELFVKDNTAFSLKDGRDITAVSLSFMAAPDGRHGDLVTESERLTNNHKIY